MDFPVGLDADEPHGGGQLAVARDRRAGAADQAARSRIGRLDDPPTFLFEYQPGPATLATLVSLGGESFRLVVCEGENLDGQELPALEMPCGRFRPDVGVRACLDAWLRPAARTTR